MQGPSSSKFMSKFDCKSQKFKHESHNAWRRSEEDDEIKFKQFYNFIKNDKLIIYNRNK